MNVNRSSHPLAQPGRESGPIDGRGPDSVSFLIRMFIWLIGVAMGFELIGGKYPKFNWDWISGAKLTELSQGVLEGSTWAPVAWTLQELIIPYSAPISVAVMVLQLVISLSYLTGFLVRLASVVGLPMFVGMLVFPQTVRTPPWFITALVVIIMIYPEGMFGLDRWLTGRLRANDTFWARRLLSIISLDFGTWFVSPKRFAILVGTTGGAAALALFHMANRNEQILRLTMLEAAIYGVVLTAAAVLYRAGTVTTFELGGAMLRVKLGFAALWTVLANTSTKITGLPGFADPQQLRDLFTDVIGVSHWGPMAYLAREILAPNADLVSLETGIVQLGLGVALVLGIHQRRVNGLAVVYFAIVCVIGFTRTTQYALLFAVTVLAFGGGWALSIDRLLAKPKPDLGIPKRLAIILPVLSLLSLLVLIYVPVTTNPYDTNVAGAVFLTLVITLGPPAVLLERRLRSTRSTCDCHPASTAAPAPALRTEPPVPPTTAETWIELGPMTLPSSPAAPLGSNG